LTVTACVLVARGQPPARIDPLRAAARLHCVDQRDPTGVAAGVLEHVVEPLVEIASRAQHDLGVGEHTRVAGARLVLMRIGVRSQDLLGATTAPRHRAAVTAPAWRASPGSPSRRYAAEFSG